MDMNGPESWNRTTVPRSTNECSTIELNRVVIGGPSPFGAFPHDLSLDLSIHDY